MGTLRHNFEILWRITSEYALNYKGGMALAYLSILGVTLFALAIPWIVGTGVDSVLSPGERSGFLAEFSVPMGLLFLALAVVVINVLRGACAFGQTYFGESVSQRVAYRLRNEFYNHLQRMSFAFHDKEHTGNLMSKATVDVEAIRRFVQAGLIRSSFMVMLLVGVGLRVGAIDRDLALLSLIFVPIIVWRAGYIAIRLRRTWLLVQTELGHMTTVLQENLSGQRVVKAFDAEEYEQEKFRFRAENVAKHAYEAAVLDADNSSMMTVFYVVAVALVLWAGGREVITGGLTIGQLGEFILLLDLLARPVRMVAFVVNTFARAIGAGERIFAVLDAQSPVQEKPGALALPRVQGHVRFEGVSFSYDSVSPVVRNVNQEVQPTQVIALLGSPGSGKTTMVHLLPRFYDVTDGRILIDGHDIREVTLQSLRANIGIVQQDVFLFTDTIEANIAYGAVDVSHEQVVQAAKIAQLHDFIMTLPEEYDTWVGERGATLSGGQRQRLAIARTILLDPPILILDDSTSSVDTETELHIRQAMKEVIKGRTTFIIANRLSTVKDADIILVMKDGQIIQRGNHRELIQQPGPYQEIYELQLRPQESALTNGAEPAPDVDSRVGPATTSSTMEAE